MANTKISDLTALTGANLQDVDLLPIVDSDENNDGTTTDKQTKSITIEEFKTGIFSNASFPQVQITNGPTLGDSDDGTGTSSDTSSALKIQNSDGYVNIGPTNSSYSHFYTDRARYFFNKKIIVDEGIVSAYNEHDLILTTGASPTTSSTGVFIKNSTHEVGIGTNTPLAPAHIYKYDDTNSNLTEILRLERDCGDIDSSSSAEGGFINLRVTDNNNEIDAASINWRSDNDPNVEKAGRLSFSTAEDVDGASVSTEHLTIRRTGHIGIGTTSPQAILHISSGDADTSVATLRLESDVSNTNTTVGEKRNPLIEMRQDAGTTGVNIGFDQDNFGANIFGISTRYSSVDRYATFVINPNPNASGIVGIGTTTPSEALEVNGNLKVTGTATASTASAGTNTTQLATTEFVTSAVAAGGGGGGGGGGGSLLTLTDTNISSIGDGEIIVYDNATSKYINKTLAEVVGVTASAGTNTTQLATTEFVTSAISGFSSNTTLNDLTDTNITSISDGEIITYDNSSSKYINSTLAEAGIATLASPAFTGNPTAPTPTANTHIATKDYVDSQLAGVAGNTVIVKKITAAQMSGLTTNSSTWIELIPSPGAGNFIAVREFECYIDRGASAATGVAAWKPLVNGTVRGFGDDVHLAIRNTYGGAVDALKYNTFAVLQKGILNHLINGAFNATYANTDVILVRDAPVTQTRAYPNVPLLLKPESSSTTSNFSTYSSTATHALNDEYYLRISYRIMSLSSHFQVT